MIICISGTSTEVGKTVTTAALAAALQVRGVTTAVVKPVQTGMLEGEPGDLADVERLSGVTELYEFARYPDPLSPDAAARVAQMDLMSGDELAARVQAIDADLTSNSRGPAVTIVEGAGGLMVRIGKDGLTILDVAERVDSPVLLVVGSGLGTLNHSELSTMAMSTRGVSCAGLVLGRWIRDGETPTLVQRCNYHDLPIVTGRPVVGVIPDGSGTLPRDVFITASSQWFDADWLDTITTAQKNEPGPVEKTGQAERTSL